MTLGLLALPSTVELAPPITAVSPVIGKLRINLFCLYHCTDCAGRVIRWKIRNMQ